MLGLVFCVVSVGFLGSTGLVGLVGLTDGLMICSLITLFSLVYLLCKTVTIFLYDGLKLILSYSLGYW